MTKISSLPLIALAAFGLSACGDGDESVAEQRSDQLEDRADAIDERADEIDDSDDELLVDNDDPMATGTMGGMASDGVSVRLSGFQPTGTIYVALQDEAAFGSNDATYGTSVEPMGSEVEAMITGITPGDYALAVFQDTNGNGELDLGPNGVPTEPWYLSGDAGTSSAPQFSDAMSSYDMGDSEDVDLSDNM